MNSAIIVAAGQGKRMGQEKLFMEVNGEPVVAHSWRTLDRSADIQEIVLVIRMELAGDFEAVAGRLNLTKPYRLVAGGAERQDSVWNGLNALNAGARIVAIHDAARPCVTGQMIADTIKAAEETGAAVAAQRMVDTVKASDDGKVISEHLDRGRLWSVQTPQTFRVDIIKRALKEVNRRGLRVTDDTAACELIGQPVRLVLSAAPNPKLTAPADLASITALLNQMAAGKG